MMVLSVKLVVADDQTETARSLVEQVADEVDGVVVVDEYALEDDVRPPRLTPRQLEVLRLLDRGLLTKQIAVQLGISTHTANNHVRAILARFGAVSRTAALHRARRLHLI